jgi:hypothetical protein
LNLPPTRTASALVPPAVCVPPPPAGAADDAGADARPPVKAAARGPLLEARAAGAGAGHRDQHVVQVDAGRTAAAGARDGVAVLHPAGAAVRPTAQATGDGQDALAPALADLDLDDVALEDVQRAVDVAAGAAGAGEDGGVDEGAAAAGAAPRLQVQHPVGAMTKVLATPE